MFRVTPEGAFQLIVSRPTHRGFLRADTGQNTLAGELAVHDVALIPNSEDLMVSAGNAIYRLVRQRRQAPIPQDQGPLSAVTYLPGPAAPGQMLVLFGEYLADFEAVAPGDQELYELGGVEMTATDSAGATHRVRMVGSSPGSLAFIVPENMARGVGKFLIHTSGSIDISVPVTIREIAPALSTIESSEAAVGRAVLKYGDAREPETVELVNCTEGRCSPAAVTVTPDVSEVVLELQGTGFRRLQASDDAWVMAGNRKLPLLSVQPFSWPGLDVLSVSLTPEMVAFGPLAIRIETPTQRSNSVSVILLK